MPHKLEISWSQILAAVLLVVWLGNGLGSAAAMPGAVTFPEELTASLLCDCERSQDFCSGSYPQTLRQHYRRYRLETTAGARVEGRSLRWRFIPRLTTAQFATVFGVSHLTEAISCWVKNPYGYQTDLTLRLVELDGSVYESPPVFLGDERNWRQVAFYRHDFSLAADSLDRNQQLDLPVRRLEFRLTGLEVGQSYEVYFDHLQVHTPRAAAITVNQWQCPGVVQAGESLDVQLDVTSSEGTSLLGVLLQLCYDGIVVMEVPLAELVEPPGSAEPSATPLTAHLPLPAHLRRGIYNLRLAGVDGVTLTAGPDVELELQVGITNTQDAPTVAELYTQGNRIGLAVDERRYEPIVVGLDGPSEEICRQAAQQNLHLYALPIACGFAPYGRCPDTWTSALEMDFAPILSRIGAVLQADPQALLILQVFVESPLWWDEQNPSQIIRVPSGQVVAERKSTHASWTSRAWQQQASLALRTLVQCLEVSPWGDHIVGYQLMAGEQGRWAIWGNTQGMLDASLTAQVAFRQWLRDKYIGLPVLRSAWGQPRQPLLDSPGVKQGHIITQWSQISIPSAAELFAATEPALYDPAAHQSLIDYQQFLSAQVAETLLNFASAVKEATNGYKLCGVAYGHLLDKWPGQGSVQLAGHLGLGRVLAAEQVDFVVGPTSSPVFPTTAPSSILAHDKLYLAHSSEANGEQPPTVWRAPDQQSDGADELTASSIALVVDENKDSYLKPASELRRMILTDQAHQVQQTGGRVDVWLLEDLLAGLMPDYTVYVFADAFALTAAQRQALHEQLSAPMATVIWVYAAGAIENTISGATMWDLMGIKPTVVTKAGPLRVVIPPGEPEVNPLGTSAIEYGLTAAVSPRFAIVGNEAQSLGKLKGSSRSGLSTVDHQGSRWIYSVVPGVPTAVLTALIRDTEAMRQP